MLDRLFSPLALGSVTIPNRIVSTSHQTSLVHHHLPTDELIAYHRARARGGAGLIVVEATAIHHTGLLTAHTLGGYLPEIVPAYRRLSEAVHEYDTRLFVQLFHGGREVISSPPRPPAVAPSSIPSARFKTEPRELTRREIGEMIDGYRQAAAYAAAGGIDGVEVCAGFNYLPTQFLSPHANTRTDSYGGSFENRLRFLREVCEAMREGIGGGAVGCRLTDESGSWDGNSHEELARAAGAGRAQRRCQLRPHHEGSRERPRDRDRPHRRPGRRGRDDRARRLRRLRHDAGAYHRPVDAEPCRGRPDVHDLHRLQPGVHRPLPRRHPDRLHDQPMDRVRVDASAPHARSQPGNGGGRGRRTWRRIGGRVRDRARAPGGSARAGRGGGRSDAAGSERVRPRRDRT